jgi:hypothetical protein
VERKANRRGGGRSGEGEGKRFDDVRE